MNVTVVNRYFSSVPSDQRVPEKAIDRLLFLNDKQVLNSGDFLNNEVFEKAVEAMARSLNEEVVQYDYDCDSPEDDRNMADRLREWLVLTQDHKTLRFAIHLDGGLVQDILCKDPRGHNVEFSVFDYDVDSVEDDEITLITDLNDGQEEEAFVKHMRASFNSAIDLDDVYNAK